MTQKHLGYTELEWTCKRCLTKNPGTVKTCSNCGAPMAEEDQFELPDEQKLITDEEKIEAAKRGADIHCPYCGARNVANAEVCVQCGGDLSEGALRQAGKVLGAYSDEAAADIDCPFCGAKVRPDATRCPNCGGNLVQEEEQEAPAQPAEPVSKPKRPVWQLIAIIAVVVLCLGAAIAYFVRANRTTDVRAEVQSVAWERSIAVLAEQDVEKQDWEDELPEEAQNVSCTDEYRDTQDEPAPKSTEVCGTPYTVDTGSGVGEVVQDCEYEVYDSYCSYTMLEWEVVDTLTLQGNDLNPEWPYVSVTDYQQEGEREESYKVVFVDDGETYTYTFSNAALFDQFVPGSVWTLKVNSFGGVRGVEP